MRLTSYYIIHTTKNIIKRLFHSKVGFFILGFILFFIVLFFIAKIEDSHEPEPTVQEIMEDEVQGEKAQRVIGVIASGVFLLVFLYQIGSGEKKGTGIFQLPDVNLLFSAPVRPQSILLFRISLQMGASLIATLYMLFQLPNLVLNMNVSIFAGLGLLLAYFLMLLLGTLCSVLTYCICANHPRIKAMIHPVVYTVLAIFLLAFGVLVQIKKKSVIDAAEILLCRGWFRNIPIIGWLKGFTVGFFEENITYIALYGFLLVLSVVLIILCIYRTPVDFYEDAVAGAQKMQETLNASKEGRMIQRERSAKINRTEGIGRGFGADVFYYKTVYNHKRFAKLHLFTSTSQIYYLVFIGMSVFFVMTKNTSGFPVLIAVAAFISLFFTAGSSLSTEMTLNYIYLVPESEMSKVIYSSLGDIRDYLLDTLIPYVVSCVLLKVDPVLAIGCYLALVSFYYLALQLGTWMDLLFPSSVALAVKLTICYFLKFFAIIPAGIVLLIAMGLHAMTTGMYIAAIVTVASGVFFMCLCPALLRRGRN